MIKPERTPDQEIEVVEQFRQFVAEHIPVLKHDRYTEGDESFVFGFSSYEVGDKDQLVPIKQVDFRFNQAVSGEYPDGAEENFSVEVQLDVEGPHAAPYLRWSVWNGQPEFIAEHDNMSSEPFEANPETFYKLMSRIAILESAGAFTPTVQEK